MKFAHEFKEALRKEGFPLNWVESAIPYSQLKKCIRKVESELSELGLDADTLGHLTSSTKDHASRSPRRNIRDAPVALHYDFTDDPTVFRPKLILYVQVEHGITIDATLSPDTRKYLKRISQRQKILQSSPERLSVDRIVPETNSLDQYDETPGDGSNISMSPGNGVIQRVEVPLRFDSEFFGLLQGEVSTLDNIQAGEHISITKDIKILSNDVSKIVNPYKSSKTDLARWREIFDVYLQAGIFFSTNELDHGSRTSMVARKQLQWFEQEVTKRGVAKSFKLSASRGALQRFLAINMTLLQNLKFQEINQLAISKILKKFDKRTSLGVKNTFPKLIQSDPFMSQMMAKAVCAEISNEVVKLVPQLDDYLCPVCFSITYKPIRLNCGHIFCIRCMIQMQKARAKYCPLCRNDVIMDADSANLDPALMKYLQKYFPKETKSKQKENETAAGVDLYGENFTNAKCNVM